MIINIIFNDFIDEYYGEIVDLVMVDKLVFFCFLEDVDEYVVLNEWLKDLI